MPVIMCSSLTQRGAKVTIEALAGGASDYVTKPAGQAGREAALRALGQELIPKIHALTSAVSPGAMTNSFSGQTGPLAVFPGAARIPLTFPVSLPLSPQLRLQPMSSNPLVVVIGVSTGGPAALDVLLPALPGNFPLPVLIVQHMPELFTHMFAERLNDRCKLRVREAAEGDAVRAGTILIARGNWHMEAVPGALPGVPATVRLNQGPLENHCRPAVDVLFRSAARAYGAGVLAVVLTGMGSDGMVGARVVREQGGSVIAQDQASSTVWGMPGAVTNAGLAHKVLPLDAIAPEILRIAGRTYSEARELPRDIYRQVVS